MNQHTREPSLDGRAGVEFSIVADHGRIADEFPIVGKRDQFGARVKLSKGKVQVAVCKAVAGIADDNRSRGAPG